MEELRILHPFLNRKENHIPRSLFHWLYFKRHILEKESVRARFEEVALDLQGFKELVTKEANPLKFGPSFCRRKSEKTTSRNIQDLMLVIWKYYQALLHPSSPVYVAKSALGGLGLFLRRDVERASKKGGALIPFGVDLWGVLFEIPEEEFTSLQELHYPSLYNTHMIMGGPVSLMNHRCKARLRFTGAKQVHLEEFQGMKAVYVCSEAGYFGKKDQELTIDYLSGGKGTFFGDKCACDSCTRKTRMSLKRKSISLKEDRDEPRASKDEKRLKPTKEKAPKKKKKRRKTSQKVGISCDVTNM